MKTFIADIFPKIQRYSKKLDDLTLLSNQHWVAIDNLTSSKKIYIFRSNNELLISINGKVRKAKWEHLGNNSLLIDMDKDSYLFKHGFIDQNVLALKVDNSQEYALFVNENKYDGELDSVDKVIGFLSKKYLESSVEKALEDHLNQGLINHHTESENRKTPKQLTKEKKEIEDVIVKGGRIYKGVLYIILFIIGFYLILQLLGKLV